MKIFKFLLMGIIILVVAGSGIYFVKHFNKTDLGSPVTDKTITESENKAIENIDTGAFDICKVFPKEEIASIIGLDIDSAESYSVEGTKNSNCRYHIRGEKYASVSVLSIGKYQSDPALAKAKYGNEILFKDWRVLTDNRMAMDNFITYNEVQQLSEIYLISGSNEYYRITLHSLELLNGSQMINLASRIAEKLMATDNSQGFQEKEASVSQEPIAESLVTTTQETAPLPQETDIIRTFFNLIEEKRISDAVMMMRDAITKNDNTKQAWGVQLNAMKSVKVIDVTPSMPEEWKVDEHTYKVTLDMAMDPSSANAVMPYYGYDNGKNIRWVTLEKTGTAWKIAGIATGP